MQPSGPDPDLTAGRTVFTVVNRSNGQEILEHSSKELAEAHIENLARSAYWNTMDEDGKHRSYLELDEQVLISLRHRYKIVEKAKEWPRLDEIKVV